MVSAIAIPFRFLARHWGKLTLIIIALAMVVVWRLVPVAVERHVIVIDTVAHEVMGTGALDARTRATVGAKISGRINVISADQGDQVKKGQVLAHIDDADLRRQVSAAEATWRASQSSVVRAKTDQTRAQAIMNQAQRERERLDQLRKANIVSQEIFEQATERLAVANADLAHAVAAITESEQQMAAAEESLHVFQARLAESSLIAPFDGLVVRRDRDVGDVVVPGTTVMTVVATDTLWISSWVDESAMAAIAVGQPARIVLRSDPGKERVGEVLYSPATLERVAVEAGAGEVSEDRARLLEFQIGP